MATMADGRARLDISARKCFTGMQASCKARSFILRDHQRWSLRHDKRWLKPQWMKTTSGRKNLPVTNRWMELMIDCVVFVTSERIPWNRRPLRCRCQPRGAAGDGSGTGRRDRSCETKALQSTRYLSADGAA